MAYFVNSGLLTANQEVVLGPRPTDLADRIVGSVFSDQSGTIYIEQSFDGTNFDISTSYPITGGDGKGFSEELVAPQVQIRYKNGGTNQTVFRLHARVSSSGAR